MRLRAGKSGVSLAIENNHNCFMGEAKEKTDGHSQRKTWLKPLRHEWKSAK
jgi:hypothetical protein